MVPNKRIRAALTLAIFLVVAALSSYAFAAHASRPFCDDARAQVQCWSDAIIHTYATNGMSAAFKMFDELAVSEPRFSETCHSVMHALGKKFYDVSATKKLQELPPEIEYCSYGFFHGLMEAYVTEHGSEIGAREACSSLSNSVSDGSPFLFFDCVHGLGHGIVDQLVSRTSTDSLRILSLGLSACRGLSKDDQEREYCESGVFMELGTLYADSNYPLQLDKENPYAFCESQSDAVTRRACTSGLNTAVSAIAHQHFLLAAHRAEKITDNADASNAVRQLAKVHAMQVMSAETDKFVIAMCYRLQTRLQRSCIEGFIAGRIRSSDPQKGYRDSLSLCEDPSLRSTDTGACMHAIFNVMAQYRRSQVAEACKNAPPQYAQLCS